jgi:proteic killer suppression protein
MIKKFKPKGLKKLIESGASSAVKQQQVRCLRQILGLLETAENLDDMALPGLNLHGLKS